MADTTVTILDTDSASESRRVSSTQNIQPNGILTTQVPHSNETLTLGFNFHPVEDPRRIIADNLSTTIGEISPLMNLSRSRTALSLQEWLNPNHQRQFEIQRSTSERSDTVAITIDDHPLNLATESHIGLNSDHQHHLSIDNSIHNPQEVVNIENQNHNNSEINSSPSLTVTPEALPTRTNLENYITFLLILLLKFVLENGAGIMNFVLLVVTFIQANNDLKREILKQQNRSHMTLLGILCYIIGYFTFTSFVFQEPMFFNNTPPLTISQLFLIVAVNDYVLKLITVGIKVLVTCLPVKLLAFQKRGKLYLMIEATSQLYRYGLPLMPWIDYLYLTYSGPEKLLGTVLAVVYVVEKATDMSHVKLFYQAARKMLQNVSLGVSPSKEQIIASGGICAICHEEYSSPVRLHCNHIFCESCITTWLDRERSCPLCRASITDDPIYRDGHTTHFVQLY